MQMQNTEELHKCHFFLWSTKK